MVLLKGAAFAPRAKAAIVINVVMSCFILA